MVALFAFLVCLAISIGVNSASYQNDYKNYQGPKSESDLRHYLFRNYDKFVRPVKNPADRISASVGISPLYVRELSEQDQVIVMDSWILMKWTDEYLTWEPSQFGNQSILRVPSTEVWRPDFSNYKAVTDSDLFPNPGANVLIYNNGVVMWVPVFPIRSRCPSTKTKNTVTCNIQIGSWTFSENELDIQLYAEKMDLSEFTDNNPDWKLMDMVPERVAKYYPCCKEAYPLLQVNVTLKRRNAIESNEVLQESPINLQDFVLTDLSDFEKLLD